MNLVYATTNQHKLAGANQALTEADLTFVAPKLSLPDLPEIQSDDQKAVSVDKARKYYDLLKCPLVVMDSGLFVEALRGFPGVYTKYALDTIGIANIIRLLDSNTNAYTQRTVTYFDGIEPTTFTLKVPGHLSTQPRGDNGRDYDKYFVVDGADKTIAEMSTVEKTEITAKVWRDLAAWLRKRD
ncbi:hypothetical protein CR983_00295 [Candidatus Saccharibacteria bacterium]|nr:MAG: hypothetical protein CR983_00295 [Candidatus Saccharibacteria bacterium]